MRECKLFVPKDVLLTPLTALTTCHDELSQKFRINGDGKPKLRTQLFAGRMSPETIILMSGDSDTKRSSSDSKDLGKLPQFVCYSSHQRH